MRSLTRSLLLVFALLSDCDSFSNVSSTEPPFVSSSTDVDKPTNNISTLEISSTMPLNDSTFALNYNFSSNCSATRAFVAVSSESLSDTLVSKPSHFGPFTYHLPWTDLTSLSASDKNVCFDLSFKLTDIDTSTNMPSDSASNFNNKQTISNFSFPSLTTNVSNKAVLIWSGSGASNCSDESKVFILEHHGASAVLIANDGGGSSIASIGVDYDLQERFDYIPSIPTRSISQDDAWKLQTILDTQAQVQVEISCYDNDFAPEICIVDPNGTLWYLDGEYVQEAKELVGYVTEHPVWRKEAYMGLVGDLEVWLYLEDFSAQEDFFKNDTILPKLEGLHWVLSAVLQTDYSGDIAAYCADSGEDVLTCGSWMIWNGSDYARNDEISVGDTYCDVAEQYLCLQSQNYSISGLSGTYSMVSEGAALWTRELSESDLAPAILYLTWSSRNWRYVFVLEDLIDGYSQALCYLEWNVQLDASIALAPQNCDTWYVIPDGVTDFANAPHDPTFSMTNNSCSSEDVNDTVESDDENNLFNSTDDENINLCFEGITLLWDILEGTYEMLSNTTASGRNVWQSRHLVENSDEYDAYIYFLGDFYPNSPFWVIGAENPLISGVTTTYAYCPAMTLHPSDCEACWFFDSTIYSAVHADCAASATRGSCPVSPSTTELSLSSTNSSNSSNSSNDTSLPEFLCLNLDLQRLEPYSGTYQISFKYFANDTSESELKKGGYYYWLQTVQKQGPRLVPSDLYRNYIIYDAASRAWNVVWDDQNYALHTSAAYTCNEFEPGRGRSNPFYCKSWRYVLNKEEITLDMQQKACNITLPTPRPTASPVTLAPTAPTLEPTRAPHGTVPTREPLSQPPTLAPTQTTLAPTHGTDAPTQGTEAPTRANTVGAEGAEGEAGEASGGKKNGDDGGVRINALWIVLIVVLAVCGCCLLLASAVISKRKRFLRGDAVPTIEDDELHDVEMAGTAAAKEADEETGDDSEEDEMDNAQDPQDPDTPGVDDNGSGEDIITRGGPARPMVITQTKSDDGEMSHSIDVLG